MIELMQWEWLAWGMTALLLTPVGWVVVQRSSDGVAAPAMRRMGGEGVDRVDHSAAIPCTIWSYWHDERPPAVVLQCVANWQKLNPGYTVHLLSAVTLGGHLSDIPPGLQRLAAPKQSDWIRLALLARHGGIWLDASIFLTRSLDWVHAVQREQRSDFVGYYLDRYADGSPFPVIDSWFLAAPPCSPFIVDWLTLFQREVVEGETERYLADLRAAGKLAVYAQRIGSPSYHTVHVCAQHLLRESDDLYALALLRAEDGPYALHVPSRWKRKRLYVRLLWHPVPRHAPALVKLRGGERRKLAPYLRWGLYRRHSLVGRFLAP